jgi:hypothetical protein
MRSVKNYVIFILACTTLGAGYLAWQQARELAALRDIAPADSTRTELRQKIWEQRKLIGQAESEKAITAGEQAGVVETTNPEPMRRGGQGAFMRMLQDPDYQTLVNLTQKGMLDGRYAGLFKQLNLTPQQLEQFKELLVEKQTSLMDVLAAAQSQGLNPRTDRDAVRQLMAGTQAELDEGIKATLGDTAYAEYKEYERTLPYRNVVNQLEQRLSYSTSPLTDIQSQQMVQILAATGRTGRNDNAAAGGGMAIRLAMPLSGGNSQLNSTVSLLTGGGAMITPETVTRAQTVLAPNQLAALQEIQQEQQAGLQLGRTMRSELGQRNQPGPAAPTGTTLPPPPVR